MLLQCYSYSAFAMLFLKFETSVELQADVYFTSLLFIERNNDWVTPWTSSTTWPKVTRALGQRMELWASFKSVIWQLFLSDVNINKKSNESAMRGNVSYHCHWKCPWKNWFSHSGSPVKWKRCIHVNCRLILCFSENKILQTCHKDLFA